MHFLHLPQGRPLQAYVAVVVATGAVLGALAGIYGDGSGDIWLLLTLIAGAALAERFKVSLFGESHVSLSIVACMAAALIGGPRDAVIVAVCAGLAVHLGAAVPAYKTAFNVATFVLSSLAFVACVELAQRSDAMAG